MNTVSGLVTGTVSPAGATTLVLPGPGTVISGTARLAQAGASLNGSYGFQLEHSPFPGATIGLMQFDGAGNVTASIHEASLGANGTTALPCTYSLNPDGTGAIDLKFTPAGLPLTFQSFSFVMTDGGSQLLLLQTSGASQPFDDSVFGTARLQ